MEVLPLVLLFVNGCLSLVLGCAAIRQRYGAFSGSLAHPYVLLSVLIFLFSLDFFQLTLQDRAVSGGEFILLPARGGERAFALFTLLNIAAIVGLSAGDRLARHHRSAMRLQDNRAAVSGKSLDRPALIVGLVFLIPLGFVIVLTLHRAVGFDLLAYFSKHPPPPR